MTLKMSFCLKAATSLDDQDLAAITDSIEAYVNAGMPVAQAEAAAVDDLMTIVHDERAETVAMLHEQHPVTFKGASEPAAKPEVKASAPRAKAIGTPALRGSDALGQISARLGGLSTTLLPDLSSKVTRTRTSKTGKQTQYTTYDNPLHQGHGPLFRAGGAGDLSEVARMLEEEGYLEQGLGERDPVAASQQAEQIVRAELTNGGSALRQGDPAAIEAEMQRRREMADIPDTLFDDFTPEDLAESGYAAADPETKGLTEHLLAQAEAQGQDTEAIREDAARGIEDQSEDFYHARLQDALRKAIAGTDEGGPEGNAETAPGRGEDRGQAAGDQGEEGGLLAAQTADDLKAKTEREAKAAADDRKTQQDLIAKARADAMRGDFTLTGSDRPADVAAAAGQKDIFDSNLSLVTGEPIGARSGPNFNRRKAVENLPKDVREDPFFRPERADMRDVHARSALWEALQAYGKQKEIAPFSLGVDEIGNIVVGTPLTQREFQELTDFADAQDVGVYVLQRAAALTGGATNSLRAAGYASTIGLGTYGQGRYSSTNIPPGSATFAYKPRGISEYMFDIGEAADFESARLPEVIPAGPVLEQDTAATAKVEAAFSKLLPGLKLTALPRLTKPTEKDSPLAHQRYFSTQMVEDIFRERIVWFSSNVPFANGMQADYVPGVIFISESTTRPLMAVLGHELLHTMRKDHPALYRALGDRLTGMLVEPGSYGQLLNARRRARGLPELGFDKLREELIADIVGDNFTDPIFWRRMQQGQPGLFQRVLSVIRDFLDKLLSKLKNERPYGTDKYLNDISAARDAVAQAMREFAESKKTAATAATETASASLSQNNDPFYSELARQVEVAPMGGGTAQAWKNFFKGLTNKGTVKADEIEWTGIEEFLDLQPGKVTRAQVLDYLNANGVRVTETVLGGAGAMPTELERFARDEYGDNPPSTAEGWLEQAGKQERTAQSWQRNGDQRQAQRHFRLAEQMNQMAEQLETDSGKAAGATKYSRYTLPGGTNYREVLLTLPTKRARGEMGGDLDEFFAGTPQRDEFQSPHFDQPNILAHIRLNDRTDAEGKRVLFVEEIQADWAQAFKKARDKQVKALMEAEGITKEEANKRVPADAGFGPPTGPKGWGDTGGGTAGGVPRAPFVASTPAWVSLAIKRIIKLAADEGYDRVAFINGDQSAERYDLSKHIDRIHYEKADDGRYELIAFKVGSRDDSTGSEALHEDEITLARVEELVGKEIAQKIADEAGEHIGGPYREWRELKNVDLKVGGEGMKAFYNSIVPKVAKEVLRKVGGGQLKPIDIGHRERTFAPGAGEQEQPGGPPLQVVEHPQTGTLTIELGNDAGYWGTWSANAEGRAMAEKRLKELQAAYVEKASTQLGFDITPELREKAAGGLPMFSLKDYDPETKEALRKAGVNTNSRLQNAGAKVRKIYADMRAMLGKQAGDAFIQGYADQFHGIEMADKSLFEQMHPSQSNYVAARLANGGTSSVMRALMLHGQAKWAANGQHLEKIEGTRGLLDIFAPLGNDLNDFFGWMVGNRAERLMREGRENNFTPEDIQKLKALATGKEAKFKAAALEYAAFKRSVLDVAEGAGLIDGEGRKVWDQADYIPFYREIDDKAVFSATGKKGLAGQSSGIRVLKGGGAAVNDTMENILMNFSRLIDASLKNNAISKTIHSYELEGAKNLVEKVGYDMAPALLPRDQVAKLLEEAGTPPDLMDLIPPEAFDGMAKMWAIKAPEGPDIVRIMVGGKPQFYRVNEPLLLKALTSFVPFDFPGLGVARAFKRILTATVTATPEFMLRNFIRDSFSTQLISKDGINPLKSLMGIVESYTENGAFEALLFSGASFQSGNINAADPTGTAVSMRRALRKRGMKGATLDNFMSSVLDSPAKAWEAYRHVGEAVENANRDAIYKATYEAELKRGNSPEMAATAAAFASKDLMDFSLRGSSPVYQVMADVLPFFNARVQGLYRLGRADPKRLISLGLLMTAATLALAMANADNDEYDALQDWDKDTYWHVWINGRHWRIPKPFELGVVFATVPERIMRYLKGQDTGKKLLSRLYANVHDQLSIDPVPQVARPAIDVIYNHDNFRDRPIENIGDEGKLPSARTSKTTSATATAVVQAIAPLADEIGLSPKKLEYLVNGYFGSVGGYALGAADMAVRQFNKEPVQPERRLDQYPIVKAFFQQNPPLSTVYESDLYKLRTKVEEAYRTVHAMRKDGQAEQAAAVEEKHQDEIDVRKVVTGATKRLAKLNRQRDAIYSDRQMTAKEKRAAIDEILAQKAEIAKNAMKNPEVLKTQ